MLGQELDPGAEPRRDASTERSSKRLGKREKKQRPALGEIAGISGLSRWKQSKWALGKL
jgi:hypothetical protein